MKEADAIDDSNPVEAYNKRKAAVKLIEEIPVQYPSSSLSVKISEGDFQIQGQSIDEIRETLEPSSITIHKAVEQGDVESVKKHLAVGTDINLRFIRENWITNVKYRNKKSSRNWQIPEFNAATGEMRGVGKNPIIISWKWDDDQPLREIMATKGIWESGGWTFHQVRDYKPTEGFPEAHPITLHQTLRLEEFDEKPFHFAPITPLDYALVFNQSEIADLLLENGGKTSE